MASPFLGKVAEKMVSPTNNDASVGDRVAEAGRRVAGGTGSIKDHMDVIASCGRKVGVVDHVEGDSIKLTKADSPDGKHHFIPTAWVERVDSQVHLGKNSADTEREWKTDAAACSI